MAEPAAEAMGPARPVVLVTGASHGIGAATAVAFAAAGHDVAITARATGRLDDTRDRAAATGARVLPLALDLTEQGSIDDTLAAVLSAFGRIDVLVNNGAAPLRKPALEVTRADWDAVIAVNLTGTFFLTQAVGRHLIQTGRAGAIVNVASTSGLVGRAQSAVYGASKAGLIQLTRMLAIEWAPHGIRVNAIAPASTLTPTRKSLTDPARRDAFLSRIPLGRFGTPEEMAAAALYLAGPEAGFITGHTLVLDGGLTAG